MRRAIRTWSSPERGFTIIELLVVIVIVAVLSALILAALSSVQKGARDSRRRSDLSQYKTALAEYHADKAQYPGASGCGTPCTISGPSSEPYASLVGTYLSAELLDPVNVAPNQYGYITDGTDYGICAPLERDASTMFVVGPTFSGEKTRAACSIAS